MVVSGYLLTVKSQTINSPQNTGDCDGGNVGLTNTSVQVQYRKLTTSDSGESDWMTLGSIPINKLINISVSYGG